MKNKNNKKDNVNPNATNDPNDPNATNDPNVSTVGTVNNARNSDGSGKDAEIDIGKINAKKYAKIVAMVLIGCVVFVGALMFAVNRLSFSFFYISGESMAPTLNDGDMAILQYDKEVSTGNTVFFRNPNQWDSFAQGINDRTIFVKDITASPYDVLRIDKEGVFVNDEKHMDFAEENYTCKNAEENIQPYEHRLLLHQIFVTGDNPNHSLDSLRVYCEDGPKKMYLSNINIMQQGKVIKVL